MDNTVINLFDLQQMTFGLLDEDGNPMKYPETKNELIDYIQMIQTNTNSALKMMEQTIDAMPSEHMSQEARDYIKGHICAVRKTLLCSGQ